MDKPTPGQARTEAARRAVMRNAEERRAAYLDSRGWLCIPPEYAETTLRKLNTCWHDMPLRLVDAIGRISGD